MYAHPATATLETDDGVVMVALTATPIRNAEDVIARQLGEITVAKDQHLQLDFANVDYLNGAELGTLIALHNRVRAAGGRLTLWNLAAHLRELFALTRLDTVLTVCLESNVESRELEPAESTKFSNTREQ